MRVEHYALYSTVRGICVVGHRDIRDVLPDRQRPAPETHYDPGYDRLNLVTPSDLIGISSELGLRGLQYPPAMVLVPGAPATRPAAAPCSVLGCVLFPSVSGAEIANENERRKKQIAILLRRSRLRGPRSAGATYHAFWGGKSPLPRARRSCHSGLNSTRSAVPNLYQSVPICIDLAGPRLRIE